MENRENVWEKIQTQIQDSNLDEMQKKQLFNNLINLKNQKINIMVTGATGSGKSSTINALFDREIAKVGYGVDPQTMDIEKYELDNLILWDSPGLGDGKEADIKHSKNIINKLTEKNADGDALIDLVLVIVDGSSRDMGTSYALINEVIIPSMPEKERVIVAINQCDIAMKGKGWNKKENKPEQELIDFLSDKVLSVKRRIFESTSVNIEPIYFSASEFYNISKLLSFIIRYTPKEKRAVYINNINRDPNPWKSNDEIKDYNEEIQRSLLESIQEGIANGADFGGQIGGLFGKPGEVVGRVVGAAVGGAIAFLGSVFGGGSSSRNPLKW